MFKLNCYPLFDANDDGGGGDAMEKMAKALEETAKIASDAQGQVKDIANELVTMKSDHEKEILQLSKESVQAQLKLTSMYGKSGKDDFLMEMSKFVHGIFLKDKGTPIDDIPEILGFKSGDMMSKAAVNFTTTTGATAGYLVPEILHPGITELKDMYGNLYPMLTTVKVPPGTSVPINAEGARPVASWRATQATAMTQEATPMAWAQDTMVSILLGTYIHIANELINNPSANFTGVAVVRLLKAMNKGLEFGVISGTTGAGMPSDGWIADATDQGTIASMTWVLLKGFIKDCITDNEYAGDTSSNMLIMHPRDLLSLSMDTTTGSQVIWGSPESGGMPMVAGYKVISTPACNNGTAIYTLLGDLSEVTVLEDPAMSIDLSPYVETASTGFTHNVSTLRMLNHHDWNLGQTTELHKTIVTA